MKYNHLSYVFFLLILNCASNVKTVSTSKSPNENDWIVNRPVSSTHFIGIGRAKISEDMGEVQKSARNSALDEISAQIKVKVVSQTLLIENHIETSNEVIDTSELISRISTFTSEILEGVEVAETKTTNDGYYWVKLLLDKNLYYSKLNEKINNAKQIALDAIIAAEKSSPINRIYELHTAQQSIKGFTGKMLLCQIDGDSIILNNEIIRRLRKTLDNIVISAPANEFGIGPLDTIPDSTGFYVRYQGIPVEKCPLHWSVSNNTVQLSDLPGSSTGFYQIKISSISSSAGKVTITAVIDIPSLREDLKKMGLKLPDGKFIISRRKPALFIQNKNTFTETLVNDLLNRDMFSLTDSITQANYVLNCSLKIDSNVTIQRSIYQASGFLSCSLSRRGKPFTIDIRKNITTGSGKSGDAAIQSLSKEAISICVKETIKAF
jgi:hypothetical protein